MSPRDLRYVLLTSLALLVFGSTTQAIPEDPVAQEPVPSDQEQAAQKQTVEEILQKQEALLRGQRFSYDPGGRRDPFLSLYEEVKPLNAGPRPKGVAGMLVAEIDLVGIVKDKGEGNMAFFTGSDNKGYFLRVGDRVYDGTVIAIDARTGAVTFRQQVDDPRVIKPYRDVVKSLVPQEESAND